MRESTTVTTTSTLLTTMTTPITTTTLITITTTKLTTFVSTMPSRTTTQTTATERLTTMSASTIQSMSTSTAKESTSSSTTLPRLAYSGSPAVSTKALKVSSDKIDNQGIDSLSAKPDATAISLLSTISEIVLNPNVTHQQSSRALSEGLTLASTLTVLATSADSEAGNATTTGPEGGKTHPSMSKDGSTRQYWLMIRINSSSGLPLSDSFEYELELILMNLYAAALVEEFGETYATVFPLPVPMQQNLRGVGQPMTVKASKNDPMRGKRYASYDTYSIQVIDCFSARREDNISTCNLVFYVAHLSIPVPAQDALSVLQSLWPGFIQDMFGNIGVYSEFQLYVSESLNGTVTSSNVDAGSEAGTDSLGVVLPIVGVLFFLLLLAIVSLFLFYKYRDNRKHWIQRRLPLNRKSKPTAKEKDGRRRHRGGGGEDDSPSRTPAKRDKHRLADSRPAADGPLLARSDGECDVASQLMDQCRGDSDPSDAWVLAAVAPPVAAADRRRRLSNKARRRPRPPPVRSNLIKEEWLGTTSGSGDMSSRYDIEKWRDKQRHRKRKLRDQSAAEAEEADQSLPED